MAWMRVTLLVDRASADALGDALLEAGALSVDASDADTGSPDETPVFGEPGANVGHWRRNRLSALFPEEADTAAAIAAACAQIGIGVPDAIEREAIADLDWVRLTQSQFAPIRISGRLWIVPSWAHAPDPDAVNLVLDPGAAFGTGSHPTTRLCLEWLCANLRGAETVLDYGCGSGILAIAAMKLGAARATGVDIDPQAILAARANAMQNLVSADFHVPRGDPESPAHVVLANILANPLIALAPLLAAATRPGGRLVLSGILESQAADVCAAYGRWFDLAIGGDSEGWVLIAGDKVRA